MSSTWTTGRHGLPSLIIAMRFVVQASAHRSLITMSNRMRGEGPNAVALRRNTGAKPFSAMADRSRSTSSLHSAYAVCGFVADVSSRKSPVPAP